MLNNQYSSFSTNCLYSIHISKDVVNTISRVMLIDPRWININYSHCKSVEKDHNHISGINKFTSQELLTCSAMVPCTICLPRPPLTHCQRGHAAGSRVSTTSPDSLPCAHCDLVHICEENRKWIRQFWRSTADAVSPARLLGATCDVRWRRGVMGWRCVSRVWSH